MTRALSNAAATASRTRHHPLERRAFTDNRLLHDQSIRFQVGVVLCVGDCALERLVDQKCRFFWSEREQIECSRNRQTLDLTRDFAHLEGRNPRILIYRSYFHGFATLKELKKGNNVTTGVLFRFNNVTFVTLLTSTSFQTYIGLRIHLETVPYSYFFLLRILLLNHRATNFLTHINHSQCRDLAIVAQHAHRHPDFHTLFFAKIADHERPLVLHADDAPIHQARLR